MICINSASVTVDSINNRVEVLSEQVLQSARQAQECLMEWVSEDHNARKLLRSPTARLTSIVILEKTEPVGPFELPGGIVAREEVRIPTTLGLDIACIGGNAHNRTDQAPLELKNRLAVSIADLRLRPTHDTGEEASIERLCWPISESDAVQLRERYECCFTSYPTLLDELIVSSLVENSIVFVARNSEGRIIASAIGESLRFGPFTLLEVSQETAHPELRIKGAASSCARRVIETAKEILPSTVIALWKTRMWRNVLGMGKAGGLNQFGGILRQHTRIGFISQITNLSQTDYGSLAVFYEPC